MAEKKKEKARAEENLNNYLEEYGHPVSNNNVSAMVPKPVGRRSGSPPKTTEEWVIARKRRKIKELKKKIKASQDKQRAALGLPPINTVYDGVILGLNDPPPLSLPPAAKWSPSRSHIYTRAKSGGHHLYKRLGVSKYASRKQIKKRYNKLKSQRKLTKKIKEAYKILSNKKSRKKYNHGYKN